MGKKEIKFYKILVITFMKKLNTPFLHGSVFVSKGRKSLAFIKTLHQGVVQFGPILSVERKIEFVFLRELDRVNLFNRIIQRYLFI